jgi:hypothetical protein
VPFLSRVDSRVAWCFHPIGHLTRYFLFAACSISQCRPLSGLVNFERTPPFLHSCIPAFLFFLLPAFLHSCISALKRSTAIALGAFRVPFQHFQHFFVLPAFLHSCIPALLHSCIPALIVPLSCYHADRCPSCIQGVLHHSNINSSPVVIEAFQSMAPTLHHSL